MWIFIIMQVVIKNSKGREKACCVNDACCVEYAVFAEISSQETKKCEFSHTTSIDKQLIRRFDKR